jgi:hypothetical protein
LESVQEKTGDFEFCLERIEDYFEKESNISCTVGAFPEGHSPDYCWGGCPGALQEAMHIFRGFNPRVEKEMEKIRYVVGRVEGPLDLEEGEKVIFAGDCTRWKGELNGKNVRITDSYRGKDQIDIHETPSNDMLLKFLSSTGRCVKGRSSGYIHARGCPVSVADHVNYLSFMGKIGNPNLDPRIFLSANTAYWQMRLHRILNRFFG